MICVLIPSNLSNPLYLSHSGHSHRGAEAAAAHGAPELSKGLLGSACGVEALRQQHNAVEEEKRRQAVDDILEILNAERERKKKTVKNAYADSKVSAKQCYGQTSDTLNNDLHVSEGDVVLKVTSKISLDESLGLCECLVPTTTEEGDAREAQQCGDKGAVWHPTQTAHAAVIATC